MAPFKPGPFTPVHVVLILIGLAIIAAAAFHKEPVAKPSPPQEVKLEVSIIDGHYSYAIRSMEGKELAVVTCAPSLQPPAAPEKIDYKF